METGKLSGIIAVLAAAVLWCGCSGEEVPIGPEFNYGKKDSVILNVNFRLQEDLSGRGTRAEVDDRLVEDVNIYVVDGAGELVHHGFYNCGVDMQLEVYDNMEYTVYAVANAGERLPAGDGAQVQGLEYSIEDISGIKSGNGAVLMSGVSAPQMLSGKRSITVYLTRCVAKINLKADYSALYDDVEITVNKVQLRNAPAITEIFGENRISSSSDAINGEIVYKPSAEELGRGIVFWQFENLQGALQPENTSQQQKQWPQGSRYAGICSYIELQASYKSPRKVGEILYRFYLGKDMVGNYDVARNTQMNITVSFTKDGAVEENTWRVDNSEILDLVTDIELSPASMEFTQLGETREITATVYPSTAYNRELVWESSNGSVAQVDENGRVTSIGNGECEIVAGSTDGTGISAVCSVVVDYQETPPPPAKVEVTGVNVVPGSLSLVVGQSSRLQATVLPTDATEKGVQWSCSNSSVATVDGYGKVTAIAAGECTVYAASTSKSEIKGECAVTVTAPAVDAPLDFSEKSLQMYDGQKYTLQFSAAAADAGKVTATSSNPSVVKVVGISATGVEIEALAAGNATISAGLSGVMQTTCSVTVEKLRIVPVSDEIIMYNHFYEDIEYSVYPAWAAKEFTLEVNGSSGLLCGYEGIANRVIPQFGAAQALPAGGTITLRLQGREDVSAQVNATVRPMLGMTGSMKVNANQGNTDAVRSLGLEKHPRAEVTFRWAEADGVKYYGAPGAGNVEISPEEDKIIFPIPNSANGLYRLIASVTGDDGYGASGESYAGRFCDITIYETIYLVGISKTMDREKVAGEQHSWRYENEIVAKWLSHPNSLKYPQGEVALDLPFTYKGVTYTDSHTGATETFTFTFEIGEQLEMALGSGTVTYNGTPPEYYLEYFSLGTAGSSYIEGNPATGEPYLYIFSRNFASGFSNNANPDWEKIFEIVYP